MQEDKTQAGMKLKLHSMLLACALGAFRASAQGTLVYDQQIITSDFTPGYGVGASIQSFYPPYGQSFTPSLDAVGFIALALDDPNPGNTIGATVYVNLLSGSISGPVLASTEPVFLMDGFNGTYYFNLSIAVSVTPGDQYYFEPVVEHLSDSVNIASDFSDYPGSIYNGGVPVYPGTAILFREGTYTSAPEPSQVALLLLGGGALVLLRRVKAKAPLD